MVATRISNYPENKFHDIPKNTKSNLEQLTLRNHKIQKVNHIKFLGITLSENLSWKLHMQSLLKQIRSIFGAAKIQGCLGMQSLKLLYTSLIQSKLLYCITNWCHGHKTILIKLQKICDKFIKMIQKKSKNHDADVCGKFLSIQCCY